MPPYPNAYVHAYAYAYSYAFFDPHTITPIKVGGVLHVRFAFASTEPVASTESVSLIQQRLARFEEEVHMPSQPVSGWATRPRADPGSVACVHLTNMHVGTEVSKLS